MAGITWALLGASYLLGLRHGFDWDHIAAITDITSSQGDRRRALWFSLLYALGHGFIVVVLGVVLIVSGFVIPQSMETIVERLVGATLVFLGVWVFVSLARYGANFRLRSRWMLIFQFARRIRRRAPAWVRRTFLREQPIEGTQEVDSADDPFVDYGVKTSFGVGMLHGIGAETPTQVLIFLAAADAGGRSIGIATLLMFVAGIVTMNTIIAIGATFGFIGATRSKAVYVTTVVVVGVFSLGIGSLFLFGATDLLPVLN